MPVEEAAAPVKDAIDPACQGVLDRLRSELGAKLIEGEVYRHDVVIRIAASAWLETATLLRRKLDMTYFCFLSGLDWLDNPVQTTRYENIWGSVEEEAAEAPDAAPTEADAGDAVVVPDGPAPEVVASEAAKAYRTGRAGGDTRFQVFMRVFDVRTRRGVVVKADLDDTDPRIETIYKQYPGAEWHEREAWEMYGFWIDNHPNLIHIYLPGSFEGYPLRKDFPLLAREVKPWPGLTNVEPIAGEAAEAEESA